MTKQAIRAFQTAAGLSVDGVSGPSTLTRLVADVKAGTKICTTSGTTTTTKASVTTSTTTSSSTTSAVSAPCTSTAIGAALVGGQKVVSFQCANGWAAGEQTDSQNASAFLLHSVNGGWAEAPANACADATALGIPPDVLNVSYCKVS
jgi:hypothetical protein